MVLFLPTRFRVNPEHDTLRDLAQLLDPIPELLLRKRDLYNGILAFLAFWFTSVEQKKCIQAITLPRPELGHSKLWNPFGISRVKLLTLGQKAYRMSGESIPLV